jgi:heptose-I-phosphate ethanolaminephosphotransferase
MGSHLSYSKRYSEAYDVFKDDYNLANMHWDETQQTFINQYDNSILYNDYVVNELLNELQKTNTVASFTYFSDHGDEVYDYRNFHGHSDVMLSKYMYDVPLLLWFSDSFKQKHSEQMSLLAYSCNPIFKTENLIHLWSDFLDATTEYYQSELSPVTAAYESNEEIITLPIIKHPTKNNIEFSSKVWCHRVNDKKRLNEAKVYCTGFEIDVVYQTEGLFDVKHPPAERIGLRLKQLIKSTLQPSKYNYWLDFKNLTIQNSSDASNQLLLLSKEFNCTENIIVESACIECLPHFDSLGFKTAYYLPFLHDMNEKDLASSLAKIELELSKVSPRVLSPDRDGYALIKKHFPNCNFISWDLQTEVTDSEVFGNSKFWVSSEEQLKILLVRFDSDGWR